MDNIALKVNDMGIKSEMEKLFTKVKVLVETLNNTRDDNKELKEKIRDLERTMSDLKLDYSNKNSELLNRDKEINELKNKMLSEKKNKMSIEEKDMLKSRIRELMARLDTHLEQHSSNNY